jgi:caa(3)-type oxidase subunit IV
LGGHSPRHYVKIWAVLCVLLVISVLGPEAGIPIVTLLTAFGIAFVKAYLVAKHFMHINTERPIIRYMLVTSLMFMLLFFAAVAPDVLNHNGARWENIAAKQAIIDGLAAGDHGGGHGEHGDEAGHADAGHAEPSPGEEKPAGEH